MYILISLKLWVSETPFWGFRTCSFLIEYTYLINFNWHQRQVKSIHFNSLQHSRSPRQSSQTPAQWVSMLSCGIWHEKMLSATPLGRQERPRQQSSLLEQSSEAFEQPGLFWWGDDNTRTKKKKGRTDRRPSIVISWRCRTTLFYSANLYWKYLIFIVL